MLPPFLLQVPFGLPRLLGADVMSNRKMLSLLLGKRKVRTEMAEDGADVVDMASDGRLGRFNLIFMDNQMPRMVRYRLCVCWNAQ